MIREKEENEKRIEMVIELLELKPIIAEYKQLLTEYKPDEEVLKDMLENSNDVDIYRGWLSKLTLWEMHAR